MTPEKFAEYLAASDIDQLRPAFVERSELVKKYLEEYDIDKHAVMFREDKRVSTKDEDGKPTKETIVSWKLPANWQEKIVEIANAFLYGKPVKLVNASEKVEGSSKSKADDAFKVLLDLRKKMRMAAKDKDIARKQMSETIAARLFVPYTDEKKAKTDPGYAKLRCVILAQSLGDTIYIKKDIYGSFEAVARGYITTIGEEKTEHFDIYTDEIIYYSEKAPGATGWAVKPEKNIIGKIPISVWMQDKPEYYKVRHQIKRYEYLASRRADSNDRVSEPILVIVGDPKDVGLPSAQVSGKVIITSNGAEHKYLVPDMAVDLVESERRNLKEDIQFFSDTPDISLDQMIKVGTTSGKAMELLFFQAILKAMSKQEVHEEMQDREVNILKAFITNVYDTSPNMKAQVEALDVSYEWGNVLPDNFVDIIDLLSTATGGKPVMSQQTAVGLNPLVDDAEQEYTLLQEQNAQENVTLTL